MSSSVTPLSIISTNSIPKLGFNAGKSETRIRVSNQKILDSINFRIRANSSRASSWRLNAAGLAEIEPDLNEDPRDRWATNSIDTDDYIFGEYDDHHTYFEGQDKGSFWESLAEEYASIGPPTGFQGLISWLFLPAIGAGMYFNAPGEYLYIGAAIFTIVFTIIEMDKPSEAHNFEPQIYNMERRARDKLIADYNSMSIWDFNEKYGELWDFSVNNEHIVKVDE